MRIAQAASFVHKWLALIIGLQILLWIVSGLFFTLYPIERVRSEHRMREISPITLQASDAGGLSAVLSTQPTPTKVTLETRPEGAVLVAEYAQGAPALFDARTGARLSPLNEAAARRIATARISGAAPIARAQLITAESPEYRGALPAWRLEFADADHLAVYVSANTGQLTARRSDLWRLYDALWALHIMDWRDHENFNHGLIIAASVLALLSTIAGILLIPYRFRWRRRKAAPA